MSGVVQCSRTLAVHFPPTIYRSSGSSQVLPDLVKSLDITNVQCIQFVPNGIVRVTYKESAQCDAALAGGVSFRGSNLRVTPVDARTRLVYLRDLPAEVPDEPVRVFFRKYGVVHSLSPQFHPGFPDVATGTRVVRVTLTKDLPSTVRIAGYDSRLWYQGQPQSCPICRQFGHRVRNCPLNGLCRRCRQPGHMARECTSRRPTSFLSDPVPVADLSAPDQSAPVPGMPESASAVVDESAAADASDVPDASMSDGDDSDCASEPGSCSGDEEVLRMVPTSVLASHARKRSAPSPPPASQKTFCSDEPSVDLRDNELSPPSEVPGTSESASAVVTSPVSGTPESASSVTWRDIASGKPEIASAESSLPTYWESSRSTSFGSFVNDSADEVVRLDFGRLTRDVQFDSTCFEIDRYIMYRRGDIDRPETSPSRMFVKGRALPRLPAGVPLQFPK